MIRFGFGLWEILNLKVISAAENSNKFQETRFWKEKSVENVVTLGPTAQATIVLIEAEEWDPFLGSFVSIYGRNKNCLHNASRGLGSNPCLDSVTLQMIISFRQKATTMAANVSSDDAHDKPDLKLRASG